MLHKISVKSTNRSLAKCFSTRSALSAYEASGSSSLPENDLVRPPSTARVVVCGGGVIGASVAYHLGKLGWGSETVLIEQNRFVNRFIK